MIVHRHLRTAAKPAAALAALALGAAGFGAVAAGASPSQNESFRVVVSNGTGTVYAHGVFDRTGSDTERNSSDVFRFGNGKLVVSHPASTSTGGSYSLDPTTCKFTYTDTGTYTIKGGTGAYAGATGSGRYTATGSGVTMRNADGSCNTSAPPASERQVVHAHGTISLSMAPRSTAASPPHPLRRRRDGQLPAPHSDCSTRSAHPLTASAMCNATPAAVRWVVSTTSASSCSQVLAASA